MKRVFSVFSNIINWIRINISHLMHLPSLLQEKDGRPAVLIALAEPGHPYYETWRKGIEQNGWKVIWLSRSWELHFAHQLLLYFAVCPFVQAVHLIDIELWTLFGGNNSIRRILSFMTLRMIIGWPRLLGKHVVYSFGNIVPHEADTLLEKKRHRLICSHVHDVISLSPRLTQSLIEIGIPEDRIWPVEHADIAAYFPVKDDLPDFRTQWNIPPHAVIILYIGNIRPYKGIELAVEGFKKTADTNLRLFIAGNPCSGYREEDIQKLTQDDPRIILGPLRFLTNEEMGWIFRGSDYCLLSYHNIGHSGLICQSLGLGVPVIAARVGCLPDYLNSGAGLLFNTGDPDDLANLLDHKLRDFDRNKATAIGLAIMQPRTTERIGQRLVRIYEYRRGGLVPETNWLF